MVASHPARAARPDRIHTNSICAAERIRIPDTLTGSQTVDLWLITAPGWHPLWSQYGIVCLRLDDVEGMLPPVRKFDGATHEFLLFALNPERGPYDRATVERYTAARAGGLPYLTPINIVEQFRATDDEMVGLCDLAARAVVFGALNPETADAPAAIRHRWLTTLHKTLAHIRGEVHAR